MEKLDRSTLKGYTKYMTRRPFYFMLLSGLAPTKENIKTFFVEIKTGEVAKKPEV